MTSFIHRILPKKGSDLAAFVFMFVMLWVIALFELFIVLPVYHEPFSTWYLIHVVCGLFLFLNVFSNLYQVIMTDITGAELAMPCVLKPGWTYCPYCQMNAPPRAHHCHVCNVCVLRRDHHCIFAGKCVGHANYRYYLFLALYLWIGALYANLFHWEYVTSTIGTFGWVTMFTMFMPMLSLMVGASTPYETFITFMAGVSLFAFFMFSFLLFFQVNLISRGQTSYERKKNKRLYDKGAAENFLEIIGDKWYLSWLWPTMPSSLPGDGTNYTQMTEATKDIGRKTEEPGEKPPVAKERTTHQTNSTHILYGLSRNRFRTALVRGECFHHYATHATQKKFRKLIGWKIDYYANSDIFTCERYQVLISSLMKIWKI